MRQTCYAYQNVPSNFFFSCERLIFNYCYCLQVSLNGLVSFGRSVSTSSPKAFPWIHPILAVFWTDLKVYDDGTVTYRSLLRNPGTEDVYAHADEVVRQAFGNQLNFSSSWMLMATWNKVSHYGYRTSANTFQAVLMTDGGRSFAIFNYQEIDSRRRNVKVGYNAGDGITYYAVPRLKTNSNLKERTNIGTPGRWLFRIDKEAVVCPNDVTVGTAVTKAKASVIWSSLPPASDMIDSVICEDQHGDVKISGDIIGAGTTTITCTTYNTTMYRGSCQFTISVKLDNEPPVVTCPSNAYFGSTQLVNWPTLPTATDNVDGNIPSITCRDQNNSPVTSGGAYRLGVTTVTCTAQDSASHQGMCSFNLTVLDTEPPSVEYCPDDVMLPTRLTDQAAYSWVPPVFSDNSGQPVDVVFACSAIVSDECHQDRNGHFSVGDTEVMYKGTDTSGNQNFCNFTITVKAVTLVCPKSQTILTPAENKTAKVNWQKPELTGWGETNFTSSSVSGDTFPVGSHSVTYEQWFEINNLALTCSFDVVVRVVDLICPSDVAVHTEPGSNTITVNWKEPILTGSNETNYTSTAESGDEFLIGSQRVTYHQWFASSLTLTCSFEVVVTDTEPPLVEHCPDDVVLPTRLTDQAAYTWAPSVFSDNSGQSVDVVFGCSATVSNECQHDGIGHFSVGVTEVMYKGTDTSGNQNFCNFTITVKEVDLVCPSNLIAPTDPGLSTARVNWEEPELTGWKEKNFTSTAVSGNSLPRGSHRVTYVQEFVINRLTLSCSFYVVVIDTEPPTINNCPTDVIIPGLSTRSVSYTWRPPVFSDNSDSYLGQPIDDNSGQSVKVVFGCSATVSNECHQNGNGRFPVGDTEVMYKGTDKSRNQKFCNFTITVKGLR